MSSIINRPSPLLQTAAVLFNSNLENSALRECVGHGMSLFRKKARLKLGRLIRKRILLEEVMNV